MDTEYFPFPPANAKEWFDYAGRLDSEGMEIEASVAYEQVLSYGLEKLSEEDKPRFYLQYGSTLRNLEEFGKAHNVLDEGCRLYPDHAALKLFRAYNSCSTGHYKEAATEMMKLVAETGAHRSQVEYHKSSNKYINEIREHHA